MSVRGIMDWRLLAVLFAFVVAACSSESEAEPTPIEPTPFVELLPRPADLEEGSGAYVLPSSLAISLPPSEPDLARTAEALAVLLRRSTGWDVPVDTSSSGSAPIRLSLSSELATLGDEGYELRVDATGIEIRGATPAGVFYGTQTLRQALPRRVERSTVQPGPWAVKQGVIRDQPRYGWRGLMVDVARHFFTLEDLRRYIDVIAYYKLNRLHLHLTDDQGWRIQIAAWPALTEIGASTEVGGGPGGHYTQDELSALAAYAAERYVVLVPEIDMPGHTRAALASIPELNCDDKAPPLYTGTSVGISSLCIGKPITEQFVNDVIGELAAITPGRWLHVGGDEAEKTTDPDYVSFMNMVQSTVQAHGKTLVGWEEIAKVAPGSGTIAQHWKDKNAALDAASSNASILLSPASRAYLDMKYDLGSPEGKGTIWAGLVDVRTAYDWNPSDYIPGLPESQIAGVESPVWTETLATTADLDVMVFPRILGHAELGWSPWEGHDAEAYLSRLGTHGPRLEAMGIEYFAAPEVPWVH